MCYPVSTTTPEDGQQVIDIDQRPIYNSEMLKMARLNLMVT
jgi:hypothetical protein